METLTPVEARKVLTDAQASVVLALPPCDVEEKVITQDGVEVRLTIVRPAGSKVVLPAFIFVHGAAGFSAIFRLTSVSCVIWWRIADLPPSLQTIRRRPRRATRPQSTRSMPRPGGWPPTATKSRSIGRTRGYCRRGRLSRVRRVRVDHRRHYPGRRWRPVATTPGAACLQPSMFRIPKPVHHTISVVTALIELADSRLNQERNERT